MLSISPDNEEEIGGSICQHSTFTRDTLIVKSINYSNLGFGTAICPFVFSYWTQRPYSIINSNIDKTISFSLSKISLCLNKWLEKCSVKWKRAKRSSVPQFTTFAQPTHPHYISLSCGNVSKESLPGNFYLFSSSWQRMFTFSPNYVE